MTIFCGIDVGSRSLKAVLINSDSLEILASEIMDQSIEQDKIINQLFENLLKKGKCSRDDIAKIVATGYGRNSVDFADTTITEISCHASGVHHLLPDTSTVIEIGGQDSKFLRLNEDGSVRDFAMNDRCAAGTGRFLEVVSERLDIPLGKLGELSAKSSQPAAVSSMCVVFAETEIIGLLASGTSIEDIIAGVQHSIATRISSMAGSNITPPTVFTGGVALIPGMDKALEEVLGQPVSIAPDPQMTGALGAAILASRQ
ncbi:acyl-CoA dehydratase activase [Planctomycetota bacterium]